MKSRAVLIVSILIALLFFYAGGLKLAEIRAPGMETKAFLDFGYAIWFMYVVGVWEVIGGVMLLIPPARFYGAVLLAVDMAGAFVTHLRAGQYPNALVPLVLFVLLVWIASRGRPSAARATPMAV